MSLSTAEESSVVATQSRDLHVAEERVCEHACAAEHPYVGSVGRPLPKMHDVGDPKMRWGIIGGSEPEAGEDSNGGGDDAAVETVIASQSPAWNGWRCHCRDLQPDDDDVAFMGIWRRWVEQAERTATVDVMRRFATVADAISRNTTHMPASGASSRRRRMGPRAVFALAGSNAGDHDATMRYTEHLTQGYFKHAHSAFVTPEDFRSFRHASRYISQQLLRVRTSHRNQDFPDAGAEEDSDEGEWFDDVGTKRVDRAGALECVHQLKEKRIAKQVILVISRADAVPKDVLRSVLNSWGNTCIEVGLPLFIIMGLQDPVSKKLLLFEGELACPMSVVDAVSLFDPQSVSGHILDMLAEDAGCPFVCTPEMLNWLRDRFLYKSSSVSQLLMTVKSMIKTSTMTNPLAQLCEPLPQVPLLALPSDRFATAKLQKGVVESEFRGRIQDAQSELLGRLRAVLGATAKHSDDDELCDVHCVAVRHQDLDDLAVLEKGAQAAAEAVLWRQRLCNSLGHWDALLCAAVQTSKYEWRLRRLLRLVQEISPVADRTPDDEERSVTSLIGQCLKPLDSQFTKDDVAKLLSALGDVGVFVDEGMQVELERIQQRFDDVGDTEAGLAEVKQNLRSWFYELKKKAWRPLTGPARQLFLSAFATSPTLSEQVQKNMGCQEDKLSISTLQPLGHSDWDGSLLFRVLECFNARNVEVADLFKKFAEHARASDEPSASVEERFGKALVGLHMLGLHAPRPSSAVAEKSKQPFSGWSTKRLHFGHAWVQPEEFHDRALPASAHAPGAAGDEEPVADAGVRPRSASPVREPLGTFVSTPDTGSSARKRRFSRHGTPEAPPLPIHLQRCLPPRAAGASKEGEYAEGPLLKRHKVKVFME